jgi:L-lactate dehydrogenase complex protein LldG
MTDARTEILARIRQAMPQAYLPAADGYTPPPPTPPDFTEPLVDVFTRALEAVQGVVHLVENQQAARDWLEAEFRSKGVSRVLSWESIDWLVPGLKETLDVAGVELIPSILAGSDRKADLLRLESATVGLTGAIAGLARTGSIVFHADSYHGRLASLLPPVHYAVLYADQLYPDLAAWLSTVRAGSAIADSSNTVIITGPSRTADIAQTLTLGAHGPKELHVVLIG